MHQVNSNSYLELLCVVVGSQQTRGETTEDSDGDSEVGLANWLVCSDDEDSDHTAPAVKTVEYHREQAGKEPAVLTMSLIATHHSLWVRLVCMWLCLRVLLIIS